MNEFLLLAVVIVYLAIRYGTPTLETRRDRQGRESEQSSYPAGKQED